MWNRGGQRNGGGCKRGFKLIACYIGAQIMACGLLEALFYECVGRKMKMRDGGCKQGY